ncbi:MAG: uroporphyrinogen decarboxylase family protein, partial [Candidatus Kariarchaeaceae archaeon]
MGNYDIVLSTIKGNITGEPLVSIWRHYPNHDLDIDNLVESTVHDYEKYPSDVVKLSPNGRYCVVDFGCKIDKGTDDPKASGSSSCRECVVKKPSDWGKIVEVDPLDGHYGEQIDFVRKVSKEITDAPIMMTVFAPTMVARKLSRNQMVEHFKQKENSDLLSALKIIEKVTIEYARACIDAGANGIFIAIQEADKVNVQSPILAESVLSYNKGFVNLVNQKAEFTVNHIHGDDVFFGKAISSISSDAINWHDQTSNVDLELGRTYFNGGLFGGLDPLQMFEGVNQNYFEKFKKLKDEIPLI